MIDKKANSDSNYSLEDIDAYPEEMVSQGEYNIEDADDDNPDQGNDSEDAPDSSEDATEEGDESEEGEYEDERNAVSPIRLLLEVMVNPINGWKSVRRAQLKVEDVAGKCFLPLLGITAVSCLLKCLYHASVSLSDAVVAGVKIFVALYLGNYLSLLFVKILMPRKYKTIADSNFGKEFVMLLISTLAIFFTLYQCLPMLGPVLTFLPLWTIYLAMRGCRFFHFEPERSNLLTTLICMSVIFGPLGVYWILDSVL